MLRSVLELSYTLLLFEAPHRLRQTLADLFDIVGDRPMAVVREATKRYEEVFRGTATQCLEHFAQPRGEFTLVVGGRLKGEAPSLRDAEESLRTLLGQGVSSREARGLVASSTGVSRKDVYRMWLRVKGEVDA